MENPQVVQCKYNEKLISNKVRKRNQWRKYNLSTNATITIGFLYARK